MYLWCNQRTILTSTKMDWWRVTISCFLERLAGRQHVGFCLNYCSSSSSEKKSIHFSVCTFSEISLFFGVVCTSDQLSGGPS